MGKFKKKITNLGKSCMERRIQIEDDVHDITTLILKKFFFLCQTKVVLASMLFCCFFLKKYYLSKSWVRLLLSTNWLWVIIHYGFSQR